MRNRHRPRLCRSCEAPMAGDTGTCWRCGVEWAPEETPRTTLRLVSSGYDEGGSRERDVAAALQGVTASS